jgi:hypothetical protein
MPVLKRGKGNIQSVLRHATGWTAEELWFDSQQKQEIFLFSIAS